MAWVKEILEARPERKTYLIRTYGGLLAEIDMDLNIVHDLFDSDSCTIVKNELGEFKLIKPNGYSFPNNTKDILLKILKLHADKTINDAGFACITMEELRLQYSIS